MQISPIMMRFLLVACMLSLALVATFFLRQRRLAPLEYAFWGLAAILLPVVGPFLVIWIKPGNQRI